MYIVKHELCKLHYSRWKKTGDMQAGVPKQRIIGDDLARFWSYVDKDGPVPAHRPELGQCWVWTGAAVKGRGYIGIGEETIRASRYMMGTIEGHDITDLHVLHHCDNPACVRPDHLFLGTHIDNMQDMDRKRRRVNAGAKVTPEFVRSVRAIHAERGGPITLLAEAVGMPYLTLYDIIRRNTWKDIA